MTLPPGTRIGSYEIVSKLGEGGMGEVFRARDTKLGCDVAAKVLPAFATTMAASATPPASAPTGTDGKVVGFPAFLADHRRFLFSMAESRTTPSAIYLGTRGGSAASAPRWRRDGREIVYQRPDRTLMAVSVSGTGASLKAGTPSPLFRIATQPGPGNPFDVSADGQHFLVNTMLPARMPPSLTLIVNWPTLAAQQQSPQP